MQIGSTSDAGSQYRCGRVGRGIQPPFTPQPARTQTYTKSIENARFPTFQLNHHDGRIDGWTKPLIELRVRNKRGEKIRDGELK